jgi:hypothetical protein
MVVVSGEDKIFKDIALLQQMLAAPLKADDMINFMNKKGKPFM